ncbi:MAG: hypothetical protein IKB95_01510 [Bacteroidales bacterium]|nr:hypothetical protein [Bacteroidales bacterium]
MVNVLKVLFVVIVCIAFLCTCDFFNIKAISNTDSFSFQALDIEQKGSLSNFVVLSDGSFAIAYNNEIICYYSKNLEFVYCIKIQEVQGTMLLCEYNNNVAFVQSRHQNAYVVRANDNKLSVERIQEEFSNYNSAEFWRENAIVVFQQDARKYTLKRYGLYDKFFNSQTDTFEITDLNGNVLFVRSETNSYKGKLLLFFFLVVLVIGVLAICVFYFKQRNNNKHLY